MLYRSGQLVMPLGSCGELVLNLLSLTLFFLCVKLMCKLRAFLCKYSAPESCETLFTSSATLVLCVVKCGN